MPNLRPVKRVTHRAGDAPGFVDAKNKIRVERVAPHLLRITIGKEARVYEARDPDTFSRIEAELRRWGK
jgi:hypothetical protein